MILSGHRNPKTEAARFGSLKVSQGLSRSHRGLSGSPRFSTVLKHAH